MNNAEKANIEVPWICPLCGESYSVSQIDIEIMGTPTCTECGGVMGIAHE